MKTILRFFRHPTADEVRQHQLHEAERLQAERLQAEHVAATEMHAALAGVYRARVLRLRGEMTAQAPATLKVAR